MITWMCRIPHEEPYQAKMDLVSFLILACVVYLGRDIIFAHIRTLGKNGE